MEQRISSLHIRKVLLPMIEPARRRLKTTSAQAITWYDGAGPQINAIIDPSMQLELARNRVTVNKGSPSRTSTEQANYLMRVFNVRFAFVNGGQCVCIS